MSTDVTRFWTFLMRTENSVTRVYYYGYDKNDNYINSYVDLSQVITNSGFTDTYKLDHFILPAINSVISDISLTLPVSDYMISSDTESRSYFVGSLSNNSNLSQCKLLSVTLKQTVEHLDTGNVDYTQVLTDINTNLSNLNTNIQNKNNQSDIVQVLKDCFIENIDNVEQSVFKSGSSNNTTKSYAIIPTLLMRIAAHLSSNSSYTWNSSISNSNKIFDEISKKLALSGSDYVAEQSSILGALNLLRNSFISDISATPGSVRNNSFLKSISDKLANSNDLHTISQAIDLISTAIAQTPTTDTTNLEQGLTEIKESIENKDNVLIIDGEQTFKFREKDS